MAVLQHEIMSLRAEDDVVRVRQFVRERARQLGFGLVDQTKIATAASELARNTVHYGGGGVLRLETLEQKNRCGLRLTFEDQGPGIPDIELALKDGYTTGKGLGLGLGGSKRLMNEFEILSRPGVGTRIRIVKWR
jgi:serine/threonine-protein kinase RsbT